MNNWMIWGVFPLFVGNTHLQVGEFFRAYDSDLKGSSSFVESCGGVQWSAVVLKRSCFVDVGNGVPGLSKQI